MTKGFSIKSSRVLEKLRSGGIASCIKLNMADSRAFEIAAMTGFDCLWTDMEHVAKRLVCHWKTNPGRKSLPHWYSCTCFKSVIWYWKAKQANLCIKKLSTKNSYYKQEKYVISCTLYYLHSYNPTCFPQENHKTSVSKVRFLWTMWIKLCITWKTGFHGVDNIVV